MEMIKLTKQDLILDLEKKHTHFLVKYIHCAKNAYIIKKINHTWDYSKFSVDMWDHNLFN